MKGGGFVHLSEMGMKKGQMSSKDGASKYPRTVNITTMNVWIGMCSIKEKEMEEERCRSQRQRRDVGKIENKRYRGRYRGEEGNKAGEM